MKKLKIVAYVHLYLPNHNAGAEVMLHQILRDLMNFGHEATVICGTPSTSIYQDVKIISDRNRYAIHEALNNCDIMITHLDFTQKAILYAKKYKKPLVHLIHNDEQVIFQKLNSSNSALLVANSKWIYDTIDLEVPKMIVYPPIKVKDYEVDNSNANYVTLINLCENKGGNQFWEIVDKMPQQQFIACLGGYGKQILPKDIPSNVQVIKHTPNIKEVYKRSKIVLMPSKYESWGRVAMEAYASGILVIAQPTQGLKESMGENGLFIDREDIDCYVNRIEYYMNNKLEYEIESKLAKERVKQVEKEYNEQIKELNDKLLWIIEN